MPKPLLLISDAIDAPSGLARITRERRCDSPWNCWLWRDGRGNKVAELPPELDRELDGPRAAVDCEEICGR